MRINCGRMESRTSVPLNARMKPRNVMLIAQLVEQIIQRLECLLLHLLMNRGPMVSFVHVLQPFFSLLQRQIEQILGMQPGLFHSKFFQNAFPQLPDNVFGSIADGKHLIADLFRHIGLHGVQSIQFFYLPVQLAGGLRAADQTTARCDINPRG